jgi:hypothetical protein
LLAAGEFSFGKREIGFRLREIFFRLLDGGGFRPAFQLKQQLPGLDLVAARHGQVRQRAAER